MKKIIHLTLVGLLSIIGFANAQNVGINTESPTNTLHIKSTANPLRMEGLQAPAETDAIGILVANADGVVRKTSIVYPTAAIIRMSTKISDFLSTASAGGTQTLSGLTLESNNIKGLSFNTSTSTVSFPKGTYLISFSYEGDHNTTGCTISSYFIDFPNQSGSSRIHSTASHNQGGASNHGGTITYATAFTETKNWTIAMGRGVSGNCTGAGMSLAGGSTFISILKVAE